MGEIKLIIGSEAEGIAGFVLWQLSRLWQRHLALAIRDLELPVAHAVVLANALRFSGEGRKITQAELARAAKTDRTTTSIAVKALERKKLLTRTTPARDLRAFEVALTAKGRKAAYEVIERFADSHQTFFEPISEKEKERIVGIMHKLIRGNDLG